MYSKFGIVRLKLLPNIPGARELKNHEAPFLLEIKRAVCQMMKRCARRYIFIRLYLCNVLCNAPPSVKLFMKQPDYYAVAKTKFVPVFYGNVCH